MKRSAESDFQLDAQQRKALDLVQKGKNVFVTGKSGTGKSVLARAIERLCPGPVVLLAPTDMAALHLGGEAITRFLYPSSDSLSDGTVVPNVDGPLRDKLRAVKVVVIDNVNMLNPELLMELHFYFHMAGGTLDGTPFGGKQFVVVGDFLQGGPVFKGIGEKRHIQDSFAGLHAFDAPVWQAAEFNVVELDHVYRQGDPRDIEILDAIRTGELLRPVNAALAKRWSDDCGAVGAYVNYLELLNGRCVTFDIDADPMTVKLCATRKMANELNDKEKGETERLGETFCFNGVVQGMFPMASLPTEECLRLNVGEKVTILADDPAGVYAGGVVGTMLGRCGPFLNVELCDGQEVDIAAEEWLSYKYELAKGDDGKPTLRKSVGGSFVQLPLAAGSAVSIDQAQGLTLPNVLLAPDDGQRFATGQFYVAISQLSSLGNLHFDRPVEASECCADLKVLDFYARTVPSKGSVTGKVD